MTLGGTAAHRSAGDLPAPVRRAVEEAERVGFELSCSPEQGRLLAVLASGIPAGGAIGETGTGCGVGLAWLASGRGRACGCTVWNGMPGLRPLRGEPLRAPAPK